MAKETEQQTMEEYLLSQLDTPVVLKDGTMMTKPDGSPMTTEQREQSQTACRLSYAESRRRKADRPRATESGPVHPEHSDEGENHEDSSPLYARGRLTQGLRHRCITN